MKLGAHLSTQGGYSKALERAVGIGGNCLQIFSSSPRSWKLADPSRQEIEKFIAAKRQLKVEPVYFHASYLINLADSGRIGHLSKKSLINELNLAAKMEITGSIIHLGSFKDKGESPIAGHPRYPVLVKNIKEVLKQSAAPAYFLIENAGNRKIGWNLEDIGRLLTDINSPRVKVCLDTCHLHSAGYDLNNLSGFLKALRKITSLKNVLVWHLNDSRDEFGSFRDRHENIGEGKIGLQVFENLLNNKETKSSVFIIETPGFDNKGPDKKNLDILKSLVKNV